MGLQTLASPMCAFLGPRELTDEMKKKKRGTLQTKNKNRQAQTKILSHLKNSSTTHMYTYTQ